MYFELVFVLVFPIIFDLIDMGTILLNSFVIGL